MPHYYFLGLLALLWAMFCPVAGHAQTRLYLDTRLGLGYNFAEGAHLGKGERPFKARHFISHAFLYLQPRLQLTERWGVTAGYRGSGLSWGYQLEIPADITVNPFPQGYQRGSATSAYLHQFPLQVQYTTGRFNVHPLDTLDQLYLFSVKFDVFAGGGFNRIGNNCLDCGSLNAGPVTGQTSPTRDVIEFQQQPYYHRTWGSFVTVGATARFYHLGNERLTFSLALTQGLTDMLLVPVQYSYNGRLGATTLKVRGSGLSATLGYPILLSTFNKQAKLAARR